MPASVEFGQWVPDSNYREHRTSGGFHPFAQVESGNLTQGAESFFALIVMALRGAHLGSWLLARVLGRLSVMAAKAVLSRWLKLVRARMDPAVRRYSSWGVRS